MTLQRLRYLWTRRKVVARGLRNWMRLAVQEPLRPRGRPGEPAVLIVSQSARARQFNLGHCLRRREGLRTVLLSRVLDYRFQRQAFDEIRIFHNPGDLQRKVEALSRRYRILAAVGTNQPSCQTRALLDMSRDWPVIFDPYDSLLMLCHYSRQDPKVLSRIGRHYAPAEVEEEERCFRDADGVLLRIWYLRELLREKGIATPSLLFEDSTNPCFYQPMAFGKGPKGTEWSVVYAGIFYPSSEDPATKGDAQMVRLGRLFAAERIHLHLYPSPHHDYLYPDYREEVARNPYFHLHRSVGFAEVHREISRYDFGWFANDVSRNVLFSTEVGRSYLSNKFFTFLEAGLPVITTRVLEHGARIIDETGAGILVGRDAPLGLRREIETHDLVRLHQGVERARARFDIHSKGPAFIEFLERLRQRSASLLGRKGKPAHERPLVRHL